MRGETVGTVLGVNAGAVLFPRNVEQSDVSALGRRTACARDDVSRRAIALVYVLIAFLRGGGSGADFHLYDAGAAQVVPTGLYEG